MSAWAAQVPGMEDVKIVSVACGWRHSIAADSNGTVYTFGWSKYGQLGHGDTWWAAPFTAHVKPCWLSMTHSQYQEKSHSVPSISVHGA